MNTPTATTDTTKTEIRPGSVETIYDGQVGLMVEGYASAFQERDSDNEFTTRRSYKALVDEWERPEDRRLLYNHGTDRTLGHRRIGQVLNHRITSKGLLVKSFIPRAQPYRDREARARWREIYEAVKARRITGYSVEGHWQTDRRGGLYHCSVGELSICPSPSGKSATFDIMHHGIRASVDRALLERAQKDDDLPLHDYILQDMEPGVKHVRDACSICLTRQIDLTEALYRAKMLLHMDAHLYG